LIYALDTNVLSDLIANIEPVSQRFEAAVENDDTVLLCQPVLYELRRGFLWRHAATKERIFDEKFLPRLTLVTLTDEDWVQAARFWAATVSAGKQLADTDLLLAAITQRLGATLVTSDDDFDALPIQRVNWRIA
jgi:predicted nucleic acid-binding protein